MTDTAIPDAASSTATSISAPLRSAGDSVATSLSSLVDTATKRGRKARKDAGKRARSEIANQRRTIRKSAKKAKKHSGKAWADFAEETSLRATNIVEATKGGRVARPGKFRRVTPVLAVGIVVAVLVARKKQAAPSTTTENNPSQQPATARP